MRTLETVITLVSQLVAILLITHSCIDRCHIYYRRIVFFLYGHKLVLYISVCFGTFWENVNGLAVRLSLAHLSIVEL